MDTRILNANNLPDPNDPSRRTNDQQEQGAARTPNTVLIIFAENPKALQFELETVATIGRRSDKGDQPDVDVAPYGGFPAGVSRLHARLHRNDQGVFLEDLESRNGTFLDGERLPPNQMFKVRNGQSVRMGGLLGWVYFEGIK